MFVKGKLKSVTDIFQATVDSVAMPNLTSILVGSKKK